MGSLGSLGLETNAGDRLKISRETSTLNRRNPDRLLTINTLLMRDPLGLLVLEMQAKELWMVAKTRGGA